MKSLLQTWFSSRLDAPSNPNAHHIPLSSPQAIVFPYCYTYVYYESYLTVWEECLVQLAISLAAIFVVMLLLTGLDVASTLIMTLVSISHNL